MVDMSRMDPSVMDSEPEPEEEHQSPQPPEPEPEPEPHQRDGISRDIETGSVRQKRCSQFDRILANKEQRELQRK